jgi:hypothetical protein
MAMVYPLELRFKLLAIASQIWVRDGAGHLLCYVKQKAFKLRESVKVYGDEAQTRLLYTIGADRILDFAAEYRIADAAGRSLGVVKRQGMRSLWRAHYEVSRDGQPVFAIREENPWVKLIDGIIGEIPIIGMFTGYLLHPAYVVTVAASGAPALRLVKRPALFEGRYQVEQNGGLSEDDERLAVLAVLMMLLLERSRG